MKKLRNYSGRLRDQQIKAGLKAAFHLKWKHDGNNDSRTTTH